MNKKLTPAEVGKLPHGPEKKFHLIKLYGKRLTAILGDKDAASKLSSDTICRLLRKQDDDKVIEAADKSRLGVILNDRYFTVTNTGGGMLAWRLANPDTDDFALLTLSENFPIDDDDTVDSLGVSLKKPNEAIWTVGVYLANGEEWSDTLDIVGITSAMNWCEIAIKNPKLFIDVSEQSQVARKFSELLLRDIGASNLDEVNRRNAVHAKQGDNGICASHDFCDANMTMLEAMAEVLDTDENEICGGPDGMSDATNALWIAAWDEAKANKFWRKP